MSRHRFEELTVENVAGNLDEVWENFDPALTVDPESEFYIHRQDDELARLSFELSRLKPGAAFKAFLCGHGGSGKTTELKRLAQRDDIRARFLPVTVSVQQFGKDTVDLTHDALMVEIGLALIEAGEEYGIAGNHASDLEEWGRSVVKTYLKQEDAETEAGVRGSAWLAWFKAALKVRRSWGIREQQQFEPKVSELVALVDRVAQDIENRARRRVLVLVDDLEKGDSDGHRTMHLRLFSEHYETLAQPRFAAVYTLPVYFRALSQSRIPPEQMYTFAAARIYRADHKSNEYPPLDTEHCGYQLMHGYVEKRVSDVKTFFADSSLDRLLIIGGGLFRETSRAIRLAVMRAIVEGVSQVKAEHVEAAAQQIRKDYQPIIRGEASAILARVMRSKAGWVEGVEPYLQSRAVVEYENGDMWLDVRSVLKAHVSATHPSSD